MKAEHKEWLGIAPADWPVYLAMALLVIMYKLDSLSVNVGLAFVAVGLAIWSCVIGMKTDSNVSTLTNIIKKVAYPCCLLLAIGAIYIRFTKYG